MVKSKLLIKGTIAEASVCPRYKLWATICGIPATILVKIIKDIPLPIPFSVIISPSHISQSVPAVIVSMTGIITLGSLILSIIGI